MGGIGISQNIKQKWVTEECINLIGIVSNVTFPYYEHHHLKFLKYFPFVLSAQTLQYWHIFSKSLVDDKALFNVCGKEINPCNGYLHHRPIK